MSENILLLEDDPDFLDNLNLFFTQEEFAVTKTTTLQEFKQAVQQQSYALAIVDLGLPDGSGLDAVNYLRANTQVGIIVLTAQSGLKAKIKGYDAGADYYFSKPTDNKEIVAAARSLISRIIRNRKLQETDDGNHWQLLSKDWKLRTPQMTDIPLTNKELIFLSDLACRDDNTSNKDHLLELLGYEAKGLHGRKALDVMVTRLRKKIKTVTGVNPPIKTIHQVGFKFTSGLKDC